MKQIYTVIIILTCFTSIAQTMKTYTYATKGLDTLKLDVYTPENVKPTDSLPVIIWMHGGGFSGGGRNGIDEFNIVKAANKNGYIGVSISYRLLRKGTKTGFGCNCSKEDKLFAFNQAVIDFLDATNFVYQNSNMLQVDTSKMIAAGSSAGAETALHVAFMKRFFIPNVDSYKNIKYAGVIGFSGAIVDIDYLTSENAIPVALTHGTKDYAVPFGTAPHQNCNPKKPGYITLHGAKTITQKLEQLNSSYYLNIVNEGNHDAANVHPEDLDDVFYFLNKTVLNNEIIQTKKFTLPKPTNY
ncbi:carboxylesterase family protein [uncultured Olleya sp.]|uniref:alpha/beta hydrolase n=1 Tax=uncultured Olleya sp. TaxID=757243 RepID=UPI00338E9A85